MAAGVTTTDAGAVGGARAGALSSIQRCADGASAALAVFSNVTVTMQRDAFNGENAVPFVIGQDFCARQQGICAMRSASDIGRERETVR